MTTQDTPETLNFTSTADSMPLDQLPIGGRCRIVAIDETSESTLRLMEMGLTPGAEVVLERTAWLKSPYCLRLPGCQLAVRREDAQRILVTPLPSTVED